MKRYLDLDIDIVDFSFKAIDLEYVVGPVVQLLDSSCTNFAKAKLTRKDVEYSWLTLLCGNGFVSVRDDPQKYLKQNIVAALVERDITVIEHTKSHILISGRHQVAREIFASVLNDLGVDTLRFTWYGGKVKINDFEKMFCRSDGTPIILHPLYGDINPVFDVAVTVKAYDDIT